VKIGLIVQRYGTEIIGGSEYHCRLVAERLAVRHDVEVLTTCAQDYITWANEYPEGSDRIRGVTVHRFANDRTRDIESFNEYSDWIFGNPHTADDEMEWLRQQGPWCPALTEHLKRRHTAYDALIFFTYLYAPTVLGLRIDPRRSILVPTAHDEPAIRLGIYRDVFRAPAGMAYNTGVERTFLRLRFEITATAEETVGCGVDLPAQFAAAARDPAHPNPTPGSLRHGSPRVDEQRGGYSSTLQSDAAHRAVFRATTVQARAPGTSNARRTRATIPTACHAAGPQSFHLDESTAPVTQ